MDDLQGSPPVQGTAESRNRRTVRILIADGHPIIRMGLRALIEAEPDLELVGEAQDGVDAVRQHQRLHPDVTVLELVMPRQDGLTALTEIRAQDPQAHVLILTAHCNDKVLFPAILAGALGYWLKDATKEEIAEAIRDVARGEASLHPAVAQRLIVELRPPPEPVPQVEPLTKRERQVLILVTRGLSNAEIATTLGVAGPTVRTHISNILGKLHLANRTQAARYALREGLVRLEGEA